MIKANTMTPDKSQSFYLEMFETLRELGKKHGVHIYESGIQNTISGIFAGIRVVGHVAGCILPMDIPYAYALTFDKVQEETGVSVDDYGRSVKLNCRSHKEREGEDVVFVGIEPRYVIPYSLRGYCGGEGYCYMFRGKEHLYRLDREESLVMLGKHVGKSTDRQGNETIQEEIIGAIDTKAGKELEVALDEVIGRLRQGGHMEMSNDTIDALLTKERPEDACKSVDENDDKELDDAQNEIHEMLKKGESDRCKLT